MKIFAAFRFTVHCISFKFRRNFHGFFLICMESAKEAITELNVCQKFFAIHRKSAKTIALFSHLSFVIYSIAIMYVCSNNNKRGTLFIYYIILKSLQYYNTEMHLYASIVFIT